MNVKRVGGVAVTKGVIMVGIISEGIFKQRLKEVRRS